MLGTLLRSFFATRPSPRAAGDQAAEVTHLYQAAVAAAQTGRIAEATSGCRAVLALQPDHAPAHTLLAAIDLPGESYFHVLGRIQEHLRPRTYVEIGVATGDSLRFVRPETRALGVDPEPQVKFEPGPNVKIFAQASDDFFARNDVRAELGGLPIDLAFIDGMHHFEFALRDFMNVEALCAPASTILIHDVYPLDEPTASRDRKTTFWSGDIWRLVLLLRKHRPDLMVHTIAAYPTGLALVRNLDPESRYLHDNLDALVAEYLAIDYSFLDGRKADSLALFPNDWPQISGLLDAPTAAARR